MVRITKVEEYDDAIARARALIEDAYNHGDSSMRGGRRWLLASPEDSYRSRTYRMELHVLEGSPPKGFIVADHAYRTLWAYGSDHPKHTGRALLAKIEWSKDAPAVQRTGVTSKA